VEGVATHNPGQDEFIQAVHEVAKDTLPFIEGNPIYQASQILRRIE
jgi:glutamate dehydrogenase (NADP+)